MKGSPEQCVVVIVVILMRGHGLVGWLVGWLVVTCFYVMCCFLTLEGGWGCISEIELKS